MRSNPFRLTLAILGIGLLVLGLFLWLLGMGSVSSNPLDVSVPLLLQAIGPILMAVGWLPFLGWLIVGALQWKPRPANTWDDAADAGADGAQSLTEEQIRARLKRKD